MLWPLKILLMAVAAIQKAQSPESMLYQWNDGTLTTIDRRDLGLALNADETNAAKHQGTLGKDLLFGPLTTMQLRAIVAIAQMHESVDTALVEIAAHATWAQDMEDEGGE